ncbi:ankyrin repeat domain-containing protein [Solimicrobium silvestre]|uniref:Ankyrin repeats (3 copies) n=1 Tax=Solimicrobium silvestre TaxID=2099400 RepID=A0A2S9GWT5_9BURK|nr:ankyrin repeat domain-containing protein [Solimicrobium silvestre]PRC92161.1 Ankyrin repeats (3 copies) [Solimicrobium silvestre]
MMNKILRRLLVSLLLLITFQPLLALASDQDDFLKAAEFDYVSDLSKFIARGVDPNCHEPMRGETALILAVRENSLRAIDFLVQAPGINLDATANNGNTALMMAAYLGNQHAVETLIAHGAQVNKTGWTPLHYAATAGNDVIVTILLQHDADIDAAAPNGLTSLMMAVRANKTRTVKLLLDNGADPLLSNALSVSALDMAKKLEFRGMVELLETGVKKSNR